MCSSDPRQDHLRRDSMPTWSTRQAMRLTRPSHSSTAKTSAGKQTSASSSPTTLSTAATVMPKRRLIVSPRSTLTSSATPTQRNLVQKVAKHSRKPWKRHNPGSKNTRPPTTFLMTNCQRATISEISTALILLILYETRVLAAHATPFLSPR